MGLEIERKFLVVSELWNALDKDKGEVCIQTYLSTDPEKTIRARVLGDKAFLTIKGKTDHISRTEFEYEIPLEEGKAIIDQFGDKVLHKTRYKIRQGKHIWEVDVFHADNDGLIVAEIELEAENEAFEKPAWIGKEVSDDPRYYNACLQDNPYKNWK